MKCCGEERKTPFCPQCGKPLPSAPLAELMDHCRSQLHSQEDRLARWKSHPRADASVIERRKRVVAKWQRWHDALAEALHQATK